jgi:1-acyl-sn-glycerol-3-phosphate acyltransferase
MLDRLSAWILVWVARFLSGASVEWIGARPSTRQRIYFANHTSHLDAVVLWASLPPEVRSHTRPVAAKDYWDASALRRYTSERVFRAVLIDRPGKDEAVSLRNAFDGIQELVEAMGEQDSLILFPEGTRGEGTTIQPFKSGLYYLARQKPGVELVPVYMSNLGRILPKGEVVPVPMQSRVRFGAPMYLEAGEHKKSFLERAHQALTALQTL